MHELTKKVFHKYGPGLFATTGYHFTAGEVDKIIREWLGEKVTTFHGHGVKEALNKHLGLTPDPVEELGALFQKLHDTHDGRQNPLSYKKMAKEAIKWMEERK